MTDGDDRPPLLEARDLVARFERGPSLAPINMLLRPGEIVGVAGGNGAGKTTLLRTLIGDLPHVSGQILVEGRDMSGVPAGGRARAGLAYLPQRMNIFEGLSIGENLDIAGQSSAAREAALDRLGIFLPAAEARVRNASSLLSGGERQLLALTMTMLRPASVYLMDEPFAGLATERAEFAWSTMTRWVVDQGKAAVIVDHDPIRLTSYSSVVELQGGAFNAT